MLEEESDNLPEIVEEKEVELWTPGKPPLSLLVCKRCYVGKACPMYEEDSIACGMEELEGDIDASSAEGIVGFIQSVIALQARRIRRLAAFEDLEGGLPDPRVSEEIESFMHTVERLKKLLENENSLVIRAKGDAVGGVIAKLFGEGDD